MLFEIHFARMGVLLDTITWRQFQSNVFSFTTEKGKIEAFGDVRSEPPFCRPAQQGPPVRARCQRCWQTRHPPVPRSAGQRPADKRQPAGPGRAHPRHGRSLDPGRCDKAAAVEAAQFFSPRQVKPEELGEMIAGYPADEQRSNTGAAFRRQVLYHAEGLKQTCVLKPSTDAARFSDRITLDLLGSQPA
jgi:hypothetical protein